MSSLSYPERQRRFPYARWCEVWARGHWTPDYPGRAAAAAQAGATIEGVHTSGNTTKKPGSRRCRRAWYRVTASCGFYYIRGRRPGRPPKYRVSACSASFDYIFARLRGLIREDLAMGVSPMIDGSCMTAASYPETA